MQKTNEIQHRVTIPVRRYFPILFLFVLGVALSFALFLLVHSWEQKNQRSEFESWAKAYTNAVEGTLNEYVGALLFLGDFFDNSTLVTRQEFNSLVKSVLPRYPGIQAFGWDPLVKHPERSSYESAVRKEGFDDFEFTERSETNKLVRAARREEYIIVYYIHPLEGNRPAFGFDIASNRTRLKAIKKGFNTGELVATGRINLVQETGKQFGTLLLLPIYHQGVPLNTLEERQKSRKGFVVEALRIGRAIETALQDFADEGLNLTLYDMSADEGDRFLYYRPTRMSKTTYQPIPPADIPKGLFWSTTIDFADRQWKIMLRPSDVYYQSRKMWQAWVVLFGSLSLTSLLAFYMLRKILYTAEIEKRVKKQAQTNQRLKTEIGERTKAEVDRDKTIMNLQQALDEVKTLRGILPLCSFCKKVRDDKGYWEQVDVYILKHSKADISHSICPDCSKKHYPEVFKDLDRNEE
jgi:CHASE1-domain containing sensor protein